MRDKLISCLGKNIKSLFEDIDKEYFQDTEEIRIRLNRNILIKNHKNQYVVTENGTISSINSLKNSYKPTLEDMNQTIETMSEYSIYAFEQELKNGFITLKGGFRVGIAGKVILENDIVKTVKNISSINIRIPREVKGCAKKVINSFEDDIMSTLIISPPNCGKTTILRDMVRTVSNKGVNVGIVDERSEIAGSYMGNLELDVGANTDVLDRCPKAWGMIMLLRSMSPSVIAVDEIGSFEDLASIEKICTSGVKVFCTIHSSDIAEVINRHELKYLFENKVFKRFVVLTREDGLCKIASIYNEKFQEI